MNASDRYEAEIAAAVAVYPTVPAAWVKAVIGAESSFGDVADRWEGKVREFSYGPMQILLSTARALGFSLSGDELRQPALNILVGTAYLANLLQKIGGSFERVYSAYNSGSPDRWLRSAEVGANVDRALGWLQRFQNELPPAAAIFSPLLIAGILGVWWLSSRRESSL